MTELEERVNRSVELAKQRGEASAANIADLVDANELERKSIADFERLTRHGAKFVDLHVRKDGREYRFEADWLKRLFRSTAHLHSNRSGEAG